MFFAEGLQTWCNIIINFLLNIELNGGVSVLPVILSIVDDDDRAFVEKIYVKYENLMLKALDFCFKIVYNIY